MAIIVTWRTEQGAVDTKTVVFSSPTMDRADVKMGWFGVRDSTANSHRADPPGAFCSPPLGHSGPKLLRTIEGWPKRLRSMCPYSFTLPRLCASRGNGAPSLARSSCEAESQSCCDNHLCMVASEALRILCPAVQRLHSDLRTPRLLRPKTDHSDVAQQSSL
jgi:hypothetical protein